MKKYSFIFNGILQDSLLPQKSHLTSEAEFRILPLQNGPCFKICIIRNRIRSPIVIKWASFQNQLFITSRIRNRAITKWPFLLGSNIIFCFKSCMGLFFKWQTTITLHLEAKMLSCHLHTFWVILRRISHNILKIS